MQFYKKSFKMIANDASHHIEAQCRRFCTKKKQFCCSKKRKVGKIHGKETINCKSTVTICAMLSRKLLTCCEDAVSLILLLQ